MTEKEYRDLPRDSYSTVTDFANDIKKYYRKHILRKKIKEEISDEMIFGSLVDKLLSDPDNLEDSFLIASNDKPTGQMRDFVDRLYEISLENTSMDGTIVKPIYALMEEAFNSVKYDRDGNEVAFKKKELSYAIEKFTGTNCETYYKELRESTTKYIINASDLENANKVVEGLRLSPYVGDIINAETTEDIEVYYQLQLLFEVEGHPFKGMIDKLIIDHKERTITPWDFKCKWRVDNGFILDFKKLRYDIQTAGYNTGVKSYAKERGLEDYAIQNLGFIVADKINYMKSLKYITTYEVHNQGMYGYVDGYGRTYKGLVTLLNEIAWHKEMDVWDISKENYENQGTVIIKTLAE